MLTTRIKINLVQSRFCEVLESGDRSSEEKGGPQLVHLPFCFLNLSLSSSSNSKPIAVSACCQSDRREKLSNIV